MPARRSGKRGGDGNGGEVVLVGEDDVVDEVDFVGCGEGERGEARKAGNAGCCVT